MAIVGSLSGLIGAGIGGIFTYRAAQIGYEAQKARRDLRIALEDILVLRAIEKSYIEQIHKANNQPPQAIRNRVRKFVSKQGIGILSDKSRPSRINERLQSLG